MKYKLTSLSAKLKQSALLGLIVVIPFMVSVIYLTTYAVDRYVSNAQIIVRQSDGAKPSVPGLALLTGGVDPASREYTLYLKEFINSHDMLIVLENSLQWSQHYSAYSQDPLYYLSFFASLEDKLEFYRKLITTHYDDATGLLRIEAQAYSPAFAQLIVQKILEESKVFINSVSREMTIEQIEFARKELLASTERYQVSKNAMESFQNRHKLLDVEATAQSKLELISSLESEVAKDSARLTALEATLASGAPQIKSLSNKIASLREQLAIEKGKITSMNDIDDPLNAIASEYRQLQVNLIVAEEFYKTSLAVVENAKLEATRNMRSLVTIVQPIQPEDAIYPRKIYNLITIFIVLFLLYGIACFVIASIRDHYE